jgi:glutamate carboxypeptidase
MTTAAATISESAFARAAGLLEALCSRSSASGDLDGLYDMAEHLALELREFGLEAEIRDESGVDGSIQPLLIARGPEVGSSHVLLLGHLDTVLPATTPRFVNGRLEGTGAYDMKGGFAALVGALAALREAGESLPVDLVVVGVPDEEIGGPISARAVREWGRAAHTVLVLEPGAAVEGGETLVTGRRGLSVWRLDARGTPAHSGVAYWDGRSAAAAAAAWAAKVQRLSEPNDGPLVNVGRIVGGDSDFVSDFGEEHRFIGTSERLNVIADRCLVEGELRYLQPRDRPRVLERMRQVADELAAEWQVEFEFDEVERILPMTPSRQSRALAEHLIDFARLQGWHLELEDDRGGVSFPNFLPDPTAVAVLDGLGPVGDGMHTRQEYLDLESLRRRIGLLAEALIFVRDHR